MEARTARLSACVRSEELRGTSRLFHRWLSIVVGMASAFHQQRVQRLQLARVVRDYELSLGSSASRRDAGSALGEYEHTHASAPTSAVPPPSQQTLSHASADLQSSLRTLGTNLVSIARAQPFDARAVVTAPFAGMSLARRVVPRLAEHVSPTRLLTSMVKELNDALSSHGDAPTLTATMTTTYGGSSSSPPAETAPSSPLLGGARRYRPRADSPGGGSSWRDVSSFAEYDASPASVDAGVSVLPTEEALRQHNEAHLTEATAAAAAVLARLPILRQPSCDDDDEGSESDSELLNPRTRENARRY